MLSNLIAIFFSIHFYKMKFRCNSDYSVLYLHPSIDKYLFLYLLRISSIDPNDIYNISLINKSIYILLKSNEAKEYFFKHIPKQFSLLKTGKSIVEYLLKKYKEQRLKFELQNNCQHITCSYDKPENLRIVRAGREHSPILLSQYGLPVIHLQIDYTIFTDLVNQKRFMHTTQSISFENKMEHLIIVNIFRSRSEPTSFTINTIDEQMHIFNYIDELILPNNSLGNNVIQNLHEIKKSEITLKDAFDIIDLFNVDEMTNENNYVQVKWSNYENQNFYWCVSPTKSERVYINTTTSQIIDDTYKEHPYFRSIISKVNIKSTLTNLGDKNTEQ